MAKRASEKCVLHYVSVFLGFVTFGGFCVKPRWYRSAQSESYLPPCHVVTIRHSPSTSNLESLTFKLTMSRLGLFFCAPYALFIAACLGIVSMGQVDYQSQFTYLELPIAAQLALAHWLGMDRALAVISWPDAYGLFMTPAFILLYAAGAAFERQLDRRRGLLSAHD